MDRALDISTLTAVLDGQSRLPSAAELQRLLADAEVGLFLRRPAIPPELLDTAWFLHGVASANQAHELYTIARQRQCFAVSAHIFDLALAEPSWSRMDRLCLGFAAAIGYRRGDLDPNATAIVRRLRADVTVDDPVLDHLDTLALEAGVALLGFETRTMFARYRSWLRQLGDLAALVGLPHLTSTMFGATHAVVRGADHLLQYLALGNRDRLQLAVDELVNAALGNAGAGEHLARWVAAHLAALAGEAAAGSVFALLPLDLPSTARSAFTLAAPPVVTLWRPQRELLGTLPSPLDPATRRLVLSVPTSGGKTLIAQLLAVTHLSQQDTSVCYVAPTRSLCREVRRAMGSRVRVLQKEVGAEAPDFPTPAELAGMDLFQLLGELFDVMRPAPPPDVEVMTPERLHHQLRHDPEAVLSRFGMFIFDEAQLVNEPGRGFTLESAISFLHYRTRETAHRLVLMSAALGNAGQVMQWIDPTGEGVLQQSDWRGPRRLHAVFSTTADWNTETVTTSSSKQSPFRMTYPLRGLIRLRPADDRPIRHLTTVEPIGELTLKATYATQEVGREKDASRSTKNYVLASTMISLLGHAGSVLVVTSTRTTAVRMAQAIAADLPTDARTVALSDFARVQLGDVHPLVDTLRHGVGFHHAGLPTEVLEAMEEALRNDLLPYLTCTSTLTEGINLPVRTVVVYDETYPPEARLSAARLVNAVGRAGRAGKESEGWIVLVRADSPRDSDFNLLRPTDEELAATSTLTAPDALTAIANLEQAARVNEDAVFAAAAGPGADFVSFIWFALAAAESADESPTDVDLEALLDATLATQQISPAERVRWSAAANAVRGAYANSDPAARRRWARTGTAVASARRLDELAARVLAALAALATDELAALLDPQPAIALLQQEQIITALLALPENTTPWRFRPSPRAKDGLDVEPEAVLLGWLAGTSLTELSDDLLAAVPDAAWRITQLVDTVTAHFEHFLSWTLGALIETVNQSLDATGSEHRLCPELPAYIRYGVDDRRALALLMAGARSRRLAHAVCRQLPDDLPVDDIVEWLAAMTLAEWRDRFQASPSEVLDLLDITRARRGSLLRPLLEQGRTSLPVKLVTPIDAAIDSADLRLAPMPGEPSPAPIGLYSAERLVATIPTSSHSDVDAILDTGLDIVATLDAPADPATLHLTLAEGRGDTA
jgi:superfamily II DNA/RNA helicase